MSDDARNLRREWMEANRLTDGVNMTFFRDAPSDAPGWNLVPLIVRPNGRISGLGLSEDDE